MRKYRSHKIVEAGKIHTYVHDKEEGSSFVFDDQSTLKDVPEKVFSRGFPKIGDYLVRYEDGYLSWSPAKAFEEGYTLVEDQAA